MDCIVRSEEAWLGLVRRICDAGLASFAVSCDGSARARTVLRKAVGAIRWSARIDGDYGEEQITLALPEGLTSDAGLQSGR